MDTEHIRDDFTRPVAVSVDGLEWVSSPVEGVLRKPLDRVGGEVARATSVVRFEAGRRFSPHTHGGGEEFLVLSGVFSDDSGDYGPLSYVRNPPGSSHTPRSEDGCEIFVKLRQMRPTGEPALAVDATRLDWQGVSGAEGVSAKRLFAADDWLEEVDLIKLEAGACWRPLAFQEGAEVLVLAGALLVDEAVHAPLSWLRFPKGTAVSFQAEAATQFWLKRGLNLPS